RQVRQVARPIEEARHEAREISEGAPRPHVEAALLGIPGGKLQHGGYERHEEPERREHPDDERGRSRLRPGRDPPEAEAREREEEDQVAESQDPLQLHQPAGAIEAAHSRWKWWTPFSRFTE